jgi:hypothetical protein
MMGDAWLNGRKRLEFRDKCGDHSWQIRRIAAGFRYSEAQ